ncbi:MAG: cell division protein FtsW, partial [Pseudoalteromonas sp.]
MIAFANIKESLTPRPSAQLYDVPLLYCVVMLIGLGFVMVMSASMPTAERLFDDPYHIIIR